MWTFDRGEDKMSRPYIPLVCLQSGTVTPSRLARGVPRKDVSLLYTKVLNQNRRPDRCFMLDIALMARVALILSIRVNEKHNANCDERCTAMNGGLDIFIMSVYSVFQRWELGFWMLRVDDDHDDDRG